MLSKEATVTLIATIALLAIHEAHSSSNDLVSYAKSQEMASLWQALCLGQKGSSEATTIASSATIVALAESLELADERCQEAYREPLLKLREIVEDRDHSACGYSSAIRLAKFHWRHIVGKLDLWRQPRSWDSSLPDPLVSFFLRYTSQLTELCANKMIGNLELAAGDCHKDAELLMEGYKGKTLSTMRLGLTSPEDITAPDKFILIWQALQNRMRLEGREPIDGYGELSDPTYEAIKMGDPRQLWRVQAVCRQVMWPIYQATTLPVMMLVDLGYGHFTEETNKAFRESNMARDWYFITQLCHLALGIKVYRSEEVSVMAAEAIKNEAEEAHSLYIPEAADLHEIPASNKVEPVEPLKELAVGDKPGELRWRVSKSLKDRSKIHVKIMRNVAFYVMRLPFKGIQGLLKNLNPDKRSDESDEKSIKRLIEQTNEMLDENDDDQYTGVSYDQVKQQRIEWDIEKRVEYEKRKREYDMMMGGVASVLIATSVTCLLIGLGVLPFFG